MGGKYVRFFSQVSLKDLHLMGGKGANLGELSSAGFPVPQGFGIVTTAYDDFLSAHQLDVTLRQMIAELDHRNYQQVEAVTAKMRERIVNATIPEAIVAEIDDAYRRLGEDVVVAVRSSSVVPDLGISSFPGQMDTFYHVVGLAEILDNVKMCWASLWNARATVNRWNKGIDHFSVKISALIQEMVPSEFSGVAFTMNPVTWGHEYLIEAIPGLGEALVSGRVTPDRFVLAKESLTFSQKPAAPRIPLGVVLEVAEMARRIEAHYGRPQDIEWAYARGQLYVLQSRDIVVKSEERVDYSGLERWNKKPEPDENEIIWTRAWADEVWTRAITPAFYSLQGELIKDTYDFMYECYGLKEFRPLKLTRFHKNRGYFSTKYLMACYRYIPRSARDEEALKFFTPPQKEYIKTMPFQWGKKLASEIRLLLAHRKYSFFRCYKTFYEDQLPQEWKQIEALERLDLNTASKEQIEYYFTSMQRLLKWHCEPIGFGVMIHTAVALTVLGKVLEKWYGDSGIIGHLLCGLPGNRTVEANREVWRLSRKIKESSTLANIFHQYPASEILQHLGQGEEGRAFLAALERLRQRYAFRGAEDRDVSYPRWGDDPGLLIDVLKTFVQAGEESDPEVAEARLRARQQQAVRDIMDRLSHQRGAFLKKKIFKFALRYAQIYSLFRENQRYEADRMFYGERKGLLAIGKQLVKMGILPQLDDVWFLSKEEALDALWGRMRAPDIKRVIPPRKAEYRRYQIETPPLFLQGDREFDPASEPAAVLMEEAVVLRGVGASPGEATGVARVLMSLRELSRVKPGDILITNSTDPAWTPAFLLIKGLVLETGGILAHGTVLSREYGLPAVTSVKNATRLIKDGEIITIDGSQGTIRLGAGMVPTR